MMRQQGPPRPVNWLLHGDYNVASSRLQGYLVHEHLKRLNAASRLIMSPPVVMRDIPWAASEHQRLCRLMSGQVVVIQKLTGPRIDHLVRSLRASGATTIYIQCDYFPDDPTPMLCDVVVCPSTFLADFYASQSTARVVRIDDPVENWCPREVIAAEQAFDGRSLRLCWIGSRHNWHTLQPLRELLVEPEFADVTLTSVSDHPDADRPWRRSDVKNLLSSCDAGVVPVGDGPQAMSKSSNRIVQFMAAGKPVIAGSIPAYEELLRNGENGFLCRSADDWRRAIRLLRDPERRRQVALSAYDSVSRRFRIEATVARWLDLFASLPGTADLSQAASGNSRFVEMKDSAAIQVQARLEYASVLMECDRPARALSELLRAGPPVLLAPRFVRSWLRCGVQFSRGLVRNSQRTDRPAPEQQRCRDSAEPLLKTSANAS